MLVILALTFFFYGLVPVIGAFASRRGWRRFRRRFDSLQLKPLLDYRLYRQAGGEPVCRFSGGFESLTDEHILWLHGEDLTVPVSLANAHIYVMPMDEQPTGGQPTVEQPVGTEIPERIRWGRISTLSTGAKVFVGGCLALQDGRRIFVSSPENPLLVIFYDGPERDFARQTIKAGRHRNEYWNTITPYSLILGAFSLLLFALSFLPRPAFSLTALTAFIALFTPLMPFIPPGLLFTILYQRLWAQARLFRSYRDLARLPLKYLSGGENYGCVSLGDLNQIFFEKQIPFIIPGGKKSKDGWFVFGVLSAEGELPAEPQDPFAIYGALPGNPEVLARHYTLLAYFFEIIAWLILLTGIGINIYFIQMIVSLLGNF
ncbi:hypothetical protein AGMMS49928_15540 [Spirochaetia bacterium]|nr:hypothetical protein AGMMS49928_15540 [Spirochaetia bacterium]